jgi:hypothetical protein
MNTLLLLANCAIANGVVLLALVIAVAGDRVALAYDPDACNKCTGACGAKPTKACLCACTPSPCPTVNLFCNMCGNGCPGSAKPCSKSGVGCNAACTNGVCNCKCLDDPNNVGLCFCN